LFDLFHHQIYINKYKGNVLPAYLQYIKLKNCS